MGRLRLPPQLLRIVLLTLGIVGTYVVARTLLTPPSFRQYGFYRGAALEEIANSRETTFAGKRACEECHSHAKEIALLKKGSHKGLSCEACHGPSEAHVLDYNNTKDKPDKQNTTPCLRCHEANPSRPKWHKQIILKNHYTGQKCIECHVPHDPSEVP